MAEPYYASKHVLERAIKNVGDEETLAELLGIHVADLSRWMSGRQLPPHDVFLRALHLAFSRTAPVEPADRVVSHHRPTRFRGPSSP